jgi:hypothetical protein
MPGIILFIRLAPGINKVYNSSIVSQRAFYKEEMNVSVTAESTPQGLVKLRFCGDFEIRNQLDEVHQSLHGVTSGQGGLIQMYWDPRSENQGGNAVLTVVFPVFDPTDLDNATVMRLKPHTPQTEIILPAISEDTLPRRDHWERGFRVFASKALYPWTNLAFIGEGDYSTATKNCCVSFERLSRKSLGTVRVKRLKWGSYKTPSAFILELRCTNLENETLAPIRYAPGELSSLTALPEDRGTFANASTRREHLARGRWPFARVST